MAVKSGNSTAKIKQLNDDLKTGKIYPVYLLYGDEAYLRFQNRDKILNALGADPSSMNFNRYEGDSINVGEVIDLAETLPFLADKRVILIQNSSLFKDGSPELSDYIKSSSESTVFVFCEKEVDRRKDLYKAVSKNGFELECTSPDPEMLGKWIDSKLAGDNKRMSPRTKAFFIDRVGTDMSNISGEIEKLVCYCMGRDEITQKDVEAVCANYLTGRIFAMTDAISAGERKKAMDLYYDLLALKEPPAKILALITRQFNLMLQIKEMTEDRKGSREIASALKLQPFLVDKYQNWAKKYTFEKLKDNLEMCAANDEAVKQGRLDYNISVEMVIIGCTGN